MTCYALKTWLVLAAALATLPGFCGGVETNTVSAIQAKVMPPGMPMIPLGKPGWLGMVISRTRDGLMVERVDVGGLSWQAGVRSGDVIVAINGTEVVGLFLPRIAKLLGEPAGSEIELTLRRPGRKDLLKSKPRRGVPPLAKADCFVDDNHGAQGKGKPGLNLS